ncbi:MAG: oligosaccharide flippase family protein, partial [Methyloprofundus sp.]|nr:oligosaccharide flippase family protein [Methyloprofundus sp.]
MDLGKSIRSGVKWLIIGNTGSRLMEFVFGIMLARLLVPADFGMIVTIQIFTGFVGMLASGGMGQALIRAKQVDTNDFNAVFTLQLAIAIPVYLGFYFIAPYFAVFFENPLYEQLMPVSALMFLMRPVESAYSCWLAREMHFKKKSLISIITNLLTGVISVLMAWYGMGVWSLTLAGLLGGLIGNVLLSRVVPLRLKLHVDTAIWREHGSYGAKIVGNDFFSHIRRESLKLILSKLAGPAFLGLFNKADSLHRLPYFMLAQPVAQPVFRAMSKIQDDLDQTKYMFYRVITLLMAYILPFYIGLWWVAEPFISVVYGEKWMLVAEPLKILSMAGFFYIIIRPSSVLLMAQNRLTQEMIAQGIILVFTVVTCFIGLEWGLVGVSWAFLASQVFTALYLYILAYQTIPTRIKDLFKAIAPGLKLNSLLLIVLYITDYLSGDLITSMPALYLLIMVTVGGSTYLASFLLMSIPELQSEKKRILDISNSGLIIVKKLFMRIVIFSVKLVFSLAVLLTLLFFMLTLLKQYYALGSFAEQQTAPLHEIHRFYDIGVVDANGDDKLDIYTSNHHFRQVLLLADGQGGYNDVLSEWGLDQSLEFPLADLSFTGPVLDKPGLYIYWFGSQFLIRSHKMENFGSLKGTLEVLDPITIKKNDGFVLDKREQPLKELAHGTITNTVLSFSTDKSAYLRMKPGGQGLPLTFKITGDIKPEQIYVGLGKVSPQTLEFSLTMLDRHALVWADYNNDGKLDIFMNRGALGGALRGYPDFIRKDIKDELLIRNDSGQFDDITIAAGIEKKGCSGRHARWLDFNHDGLLDLYINCYDRGNVPGDFPKQLYIQTQDGKLQDMAAVTKVGMPEQQIGSFAWFDADNDGDIDLVTLQNDGFFLYRNEQGVLKQETILRRALSGIQIGSSTEGAWVYDGKLTVADYDADGDLDIFASSKRGNLLFVSEKGNFSYINPVSVGLPEKSFNANWVDYDNDGFSDLHTVPQGLFKQNADQHFQLARILNFPDKQYQAAVSNWFDMDNDGKLDLMVALNKNHAYKPWWAFNEKATLKTTWQVKTFRNTTENDNHWLQIKLVGATGNKQAIGARVTVITADSQQIQEVGSSEGSFFSQGHYRLYFGLGKNQQVNRIKVQWPNGIE